VIGASGSVVGASLAVIAATGLVLSASADPRAARVSESPSRTFDKGDAFWSAPDSCPTAEQARAAVASRATVSLDGVRVVVSKNEKTFVAKIHAGSTFFRTLTDRDCASITAAIALVIARNWTEISTLVEHGRPGASIAANNDEVASQRDGTVRKARLDGAEAKSRHDAVDTKGCRPTVDTQSHHDPIDASAHHDSVDGKPRRDFVDPTSRRDAVDTRPCHDVVEAKSRREVVEATSRHDSIDAKPRHDGAAIEAAIQAARDEADAPVVPAALTTHVAQESDGFSMTALDSADAPALPVIIRRDQPHYENPNVKVGPWGSSISVLGLSGIGSLPSVNVGAEVSVYVRHDQYFVSGGASRWVPSNQQNRFGSPTVRLDTAIVRAGWSPQDRPLRAWAVGEVGAIHGASDMPVSPWSALGAGFGVAWPMAKYARLLGTFEIAVPLQRARITPYEGDPFQPAHAAARCAFGLEVGWR
jgi:hypothetical protein